MISFFKEKSTAAVIGLFIVSAVYMIGEKAADVIMTAAEGR